EAYKDAIQSLTQKQSILKTLSADEHPVDDFAKAPVVTEMQQPLTLKVDGAAWKKTIEEVTNLFRGYPEVQSLSASARFTVLNEYFLNSEGTICRTGKAVYNVGMSSSTQAPDGMRLARSPAWTVGRMDELPTREKFLADTKSALETLKALRQAPIVDEEYRGP